MCVGVRLGEGRISVDGRRTALAGHGIGGGVALLAAADMPRGGGGRHARGRADPALRARRRPPRDRADAAHRCGPRHGRAGRRARRADRRGGGRPRLAAHPAQGRAHRVPRRAALERRAAHRRPEREDPAADPRARDRRSCCTTSSTRTAATCWWTARSRAPSCHGPGSGPSPPRSPDRRRRGGRSGCGIRTPRSVVDPRRRPCRRAAGRPRPGRPAVVGEPVDRRGRTRPPRRRHAPRPGAATCNRCAHSSPRGVRPGVGEPPGDGVDPPATSSRAVVSEADHCRARSSSGAGTSPVHGPQRLRRCRARSVATPSATAVEAVGQLVERRAVRATAATSRSCSATQRRAAGLRGRARPGRRDRARALAARGAALDRLRRRRGVRRGRGAGSAAPRRWCTGRTRPVGVPGNPHRDSVSSRGDDRGQLVGDAAGLVERRGLDHHPDQRLGARRAQQHPAGVAEFGLGRGTACAHGRRRGHGLPVGDPDVDPAPAAARSRSPARSASALAGLGHAGHQAQRGQQAVAGGGVRGQHDVPGLLAAEARTRRRAAPPARSGRRPAWSARVMPRSRMARCRPRLLITVATSVSSTSSPALAHRERPGWP